MNFLSLELDPLLLRAIVVAMLGVVSSANAAELNIIQGTQDNDILIGTSGNDRIEGSTDPFGRFDDGYDILEGGAGDDVLIGGPASSPSGGYISDLYRFGSGSGNDVIIGFSPSQKYVSGRQGSGSEYDTIDRIEITRNINGSGINSAQDVLDRATENEDGWAVLNLGGNNSIVLRDVQLADFSKKNIHVLPVTNRLLQGDGDDNELTGTSGNDRIEGSTDPFGRFDDGYDILEGGAGDDVLIGGPASFPSGGYISDLYRFGSGSGNDVIIGFSPSQKYVWGRQGSGSEYDTIDRIEITRNINGSGINSAQDVLDRATENEDGWAVLNLGRNNSVTLHGVRKTELSASNVDASLPLTNELIQGVDGNDILIGTSGNDRIEGSTDPFGRFDDGYDILEGGAGDDVLIGGPASSPSGGYISDLYRFGSGSGNDVIIGFSPSQKYVSGRQGSGSEYDTIDRIEITRNINGSGINSAQDVLDRATENEDGWAVLNLGGNNSIVLRDVQLADFSKKNIHVLPVTNRLLQGDGDDNELTGTSGNDRIEGSTDPFGRFDDGYDILEGGAGDDVLIGGPASFPSGGYISDLYRFGSGSGNDVIIGFSPSQKYVWGRQGSGSKYDTIDRLYISEDINGSGINSAQDVLDRATENEDGWAVLNLGRNNSVTLHGVGIDEVSKTNLIVFPFMRDTVVGSPENDSLSSTGFSVLVQGSANPFGRFSDGHDMFAINRSNLALVLGGSGDIPAQSNLEFGWPEVFTHDRFFWRGDGRAKIVGLSPANDQNFTELGNGTSNDLIFIEKDPSLQSKEDLLSLLSVDEDGFLVVTKNSGKSLELHGVLPESLSIQQFVLHEEIDAFISGTRMSDNLQGSDGNDFIDGWTEEGCGGKYCGLISGNDVIQGGKGDDILVGGISLHLGGGYYRDRFIFDNNSGNDVILDFTVDPISEGSANNNEHLDIIEIPIGVNGSAMNSFRDVLRSSQQDGDDAVLNLGRRNQIRLIGVTLSEALSKQVLLLPRSENFLAGTQKNDELTGTSDNDRIEGSTDPFGRFDDGYDILEGGAGDDVLIGGPASSPSGGYISDLYRFGSGSGNDVIIGFSPSQKYVSGRQGSGSEYDTIDRIEITRNINGSGINSAQDVLDRATENEDGWGILNFGKSSKALLHGVLAQDLSKKNIHVLPVTNRLLQGDDDDNELTGTSGNDRIEGSTDPFGRFDDGYDILEGGAGDDVLIGGPASSPSGGYISDLYRFGSGSGNDVIIGFSPSQKYVWGRQGSGSEYDTIDRIEITRNINGSGINSAQDVLDRATENEDGWAVLNLGRNNSVTLHGVRKTELSASNVDASLPLTNELIQGVDGNDILIGTSGNDRIEGSTDPFGRFDDGYDILEGGAGDDVLIGGPASSPSGGYISDLYRFGSGSGNDVIIGFSPSQKYVSGRQGSGSEYDTIDRIEITRNINGSGINSAQDVLDRATENEDGWAVLNLGGNNSIVLRDVQLADFSKKNIHVLPVTNRLLQGDGDDNELTGTSGNDRIEGSTDPFGRFDDGYDILEGGAGDDVLIGGPASFPSGGYISDLYRFGSGSGNDVIIGFSPSQKYVWGRQGSGSKYDTIDRLYISEDINGSGINSAQDVLDRATENEDGWAVLNLGRNNSVTLHGVGIDEVAKDGLGIVRDFDEIDDSIDNCPDATNPDQADLDDDGLGDICDADIDGDRIANNRDFYPKISVNGFRDTDRDGIPDKCPSRCLALGMRADNDDDGDGLTDRDETSRGTNPLLADSDGDSMSDELEVETGFDPLDGDDCPRWFCTKLPLAALLAANNVDLDGDGLTRHEEERLGTNWRQADSDGDGLSDGNEVALASNPLSVDSDGDGLSDGREAELGTSLLLIDTDGDSMSDSEEIAEGLDPLDESDCPRWHCGDLNLPAILGIGTN